MLFAMITSSEPKRTYVHRFLEHIYFWSSKQISRRQINCKAHSLHITCSVLPAPLIYPNCRAGGLNSTFNLVIHLFFLLDFSLRVSQFMFKQLWTSS